MALPLHIFEPRYRLMVKRCMESRTPFGVINISGGEIASIGTIADIREATRYVDGRWDLVTLGTSRFQVIRLDRDAPYLRAEVKILDEPAGGPREELEAVAARVSAGFVDYLELLRGEGVHDHGDDDGDDEADDEPDDEEFSDEVTAEAIDEALAEDEGGYLSEEVVSEIEKLLLTSSAASDSLRDQGDGAESERSGEDVGEASDETDHPTLRRRRPGRPFAHRRRCGAAVERPATVAPRSARRAHAPGCARGTPGARAAPPRGRDSTMECRPTCAS